MQKKNPQKKILNLIIGTAFLGYGSYRIVSFVKGADYSSFRLIIALGFIVLGVIDLVKYFSPPKQE